MKSLSETIAETREVLERTWERAERESAERRETPEGARFEEAKEIIRRRLPAFVQQPMKVLRARATPETLAAIDAWTWGSHSLALCGPTRIGKTSAAAALVKRVLWDGVRAGGEVWERAGRIEWHHAASLANARKRHGLGEGEAPEVNEAMFCSLLVLDDLGWDTSLEVIGEVLNRRYERQTPTLVTTALDSNRLLDRYGDAVYRRIFEAGGKGRVVDLPPRKEKGK